MFAPYNQVLLTPAILALVWSELSRDPILPVIRLARIVGGILLAWPWIASLGLFVAYIWLTPWSRQWVWKIPLASNFFLPLFVFGLALLNTWSANPQNLREGAAQE